MKRTLALLSALFVSGLSMAEEPTTAAADAAAKAKLTAAVEAKISQSFGQPVKMKEVMSLANQPIIEPYWQMVRLFI